MEAQSEGNEELRVKEGKGNAKGDELQSGRGANVETREQPIEPFSNDDPFRTDRINQARSEASALLKHVQAEPVGFQGSNDKQLVRVYKDAEERATWSKARQDGFIGILRLGRPVPRRSERIL